MVYVDLIHNLALLVALSIVSGFIEKRWPRHTRAGIGLQGLLFGGTAVLGMLRPLNLGPGLIFDGRSIMVSLCALFFGPWAAAVASALPMACRVWLGGAGTLTGLLVILSSAVVGLLARYRLQPDTRPPSVQALYLFGMAVHLAMIALMFTLPEGAGMAVIRRIGPPVLLLYPLATILAGKILSDQVKAGQQLAVLLESEKRLRATLDATPFPIAVVDLQDDTIFFWSRSALELFGHTAYTTSEWYQIAYPDPDYRQDVIERWKPFLEKARNSGQTVNTGEYRVTCKDGSERICELYATFLPDNLIVTFSDITEQKKAEASLRSNYALLQIAGETAGFGGWDVDLKTYISTWSDTVADIHEMPHGYAPPVEEGIKFYAPEWRERITRVFTDCAQKGIPYDEEMEILTSKGKRVWVRTIGRSVKDENGRIIKVQGSFQDISEHKRTEGKLKEQAQLFKAVSDNMFDLVALTDLEGNFIFVGASHNILGYDIDSLIGRNVLEFVHPEDVQQVSVSFRDFLSTGDDSRKVEYRYRCADESYLWFETVGRFVRDDNGDLKGIVFSTRDVTERRRIEQELKESEERFRALHNASFGGIAIHDKGLILECNQGLSEITGYTYDELIGMQGLSLISDGTRDKVVRNINAGYEKPYEAEGVRKNGGIYPLRLEARNIRYKGKDVRVVEFRDITENKRAEKEKEHLEAQLSHAQKMESVGRLAGGVAHDFNNMLNVILGYTELALQNMDKDDPLYNDLTEILDAARRSSDITRQLLAFARRQTIAPRTIDLNETVEGMLKMLRRLIGEDIDLAWEPSSGLWLVNMDPAQVDQVLANLLVNARDAIDGVGRVTIETDNAVLDEAYCADRPGFVPGEFVLLAVSDSGCGMDKNTMDNLFEPFFTTKTVGKGTGLGLATVYGIVRQNEGFITVHSEPGQGTTFKIYLPRHVGDAVFEPLFTEPETPLGTGQTVLVVEDEEAILRLADKMLTGMGYTVLTAPGPAAALELAKQHTGPIDLLITDVVMPEMNGRDLAKKLREGYPDLRVLFMSGYTANVIAHRGILDRGVQFIQKPFNKSDLARKVREALGNDE
ncbi:PAS domain S-box protein [Desulfosudis oleivorans]|uniref:histidine kinase n=1 Tax=Desulfosudis oleivorans (strain DSM 6200 / JCM 39069 / Hxd3) TaxID=96561 RepID=A9A0Q4_DESOH|nr:PAS domain S-box protein [Desulfosudis oleivorans]ABW69071.1 PAS/PAC sensor hybrid histidine kinase [Desulfosudis oleivorans Hxd3]